MMPRPTIADTVAAILGEHRALAAEDLGQRIAELGLTRAKSPTQAVSRALNADRRFRRIGDDRWTVPAQLLNGATLTHRLTANEAASGALALTPDLTPLLALAPDGLRLPDGQAVELLWDEAAADATGADTDTAMRGPTGWLSGIVPDQLMQVRLTEAVLRIGPAEEVATDAIALKRIAESAHDRVSDLADAGFLFLPSVLSIQSLILDLLAETPSLLERALPPLGDALAEAGLEVHRSFVGLPGTDWEAVDDFMGFDDDDFGEDDEYDGSDPFEGFDFDPRDARGIGILLSAYQLCQEFGELREAHTLEGLAAILAWPDVARVVSLKAWTDPDFEPFVAAIEAAARSRDAAGARFVLSRCAEARDDPSAAERLLRAALDADPEHPLALLSLARYETLRGDYDLALHHLRTAGAPPDDPERAWLEQRARASVPKVGRNDRCPCGSGRKYKACHLGRGADLDPSASARALLHKLTVWLWQPRWETVADEVLRAGGFAGGVEEVDNNRALAVLLDDIVAFDHGGLERLLEVCGTLLPDGEAALGQRWLQTPRSLFEVRAVTPGSGLTVRDLRSDDGPIWLPEVPLSTQVEQLDLLLTRVLPDAAGGVLGNDGVLVPRPHRALVLELLETGDPIELVRWLASPPALAQVSNAEGEPMLFVEAEYRVSDPSAVAAALSTKLRDDGDGQFVATVERHGQEWVRGSITLEGERALVQANSRKRADRLIRTLTRAAPDATLVQRRERTLEEASEEVGNEPSQPVDIGSHPELADALEEFIRKAESNWVDESIPALNGRTPRQAAADPAARSDLEALLDDMAWHEGRSMPGSVGMDAGRIRKLLALPDRIR